MAEESLKRQTKKGLYWKFAEQFSNYGMQFIIGIFMARLLSPSDYGITALPAVFMAVAGIFAGAGLGASMVRKPELTELSPKNKKRQALLASYVDCHQGRLNHSLIILAI